VVGIKTYVYNLGGGIIEFLAIGTAVKKMPDIGTESENLIPQAIIRDQETFINTAETTSAVSLNQPTNSSGILGVIAGLVIFGFWLIFVLLRVFVFHR
jgi:hypothetical protein